MHTLAGDSPDVQSWLTVKEGVDQEAFEFCNGTTRNLYVTVTRISVTEVTPSVLSEEARLLQTMGEKLAINFGVYQGEPETKAAQQLVLAAFTFLLVFITFAF